MSEQQDIPRNWVRVKLDDVAEVGAGNPAPQGNQYFSENGPPFVRVQDMGKLNGAKFICDTKDKLSGSGTKSLKLFPKGTILFTKSGASTLLNQRAIIAQDSFIVSHIGTAFPANGILSEWLYYLMTTVDFAKYAHGANMPSMPLSKAKEIPLPIPPTNEQKRIVAKIEELFSELDKGIESLKTAREHLKVYRQAVLKHAFEGKLTAQWREENKDKLETPDQLLDRIKKERETRHQQQLEEWESAVKKWDQNGKDGKKPTKPSPLKKLSKITDGELTDLAEIPTGWVWEKLGWMTCGVEYGTSAKSSESGKVPVLRMGNIQNGKFDWTDLVYTSSEIEITKYFLKAGDVLFNRTNSPELVGKTAIYRGEQPALFAGYLIRVNNIHSVVNSQYLNLFLNSHVAKQHGNKVKTDGVNQSNINGEKLSNYPFTYCSIEEQNKIVSNLDEKLSLIDQMEMGINGELQRADSLRQSILKKAFSGQLVAQDPNDEPASVLLERIKAKKADQETVSKTTKSKRKSAA